MKGDEIKEEAILFKCEPLNWLDVPRWIRLVLGWFYLVLFSCSFFIIPVACVIFALPIVWKTYPYSASTVLFLLLGSTRIPLREWVWVRYASTQLLPAPLSIVMAVMLVTVIPAFILNPNSIHRFSSYFDSQLTSGHLASFGTRSLIYTPTCLFNKSNNSLTVNNRASITSSLCIRMESYPSKAWYGQHFATHIWEMALAEVCTDLVQWQMLSYLYRSCELLWVG